MTSEYDKHVEQLERALCCGKQCQAEEQNKRHVSGKCTGRPATGFAFKAPCNALMFREQAIATMEYWRETGFALVPAEATEDMVRAAGPAFGNLPSNIINAAIAAGNVLKGDGE